MHLELPDVHMFFTPAVNWGKYKEENSRLVMPVIQKLFRLKFKPSKMLAFYYVIKVVK